MTRRPQPEERRSFVSRYRGPILVGLAVATAVSIAFWNIGVGALVGAGVAIALAWEQRASGRG